MISLFCAFIVMSGGYGFWNKTLTIRDTIEVIPLPVPAILSLDESTVVGGGDGSGINNTIVTDKIVNAVEGLIDDQLPMDLIVVGIEAPANQEIGISKPDESSIGGEAEGVDGSEASEDSGSEDRISEESSSEDSGSHSGDTAGESADDTGSSEE